MATQIKLGQQHALILQEYQTLALLLSQALGGVPDAQATNPEGKPVSTDEVDVLEPRNTSEAMAMFAKVVTGG